MSNDENVKSCVREFQGAVDGSPESRKEWLALWANNWGEAICAELLDPHIDPDADTKDSLAEEVGALEKTAAEVDEKIERACEILDKIDTQEMSPNQVEAHIQNASQILETPVT